MKYYPDIKRNEVLIHATTWKNFKNIMLSMLSHVRLSVTLWIIAQPPAPTQTPLFMRFSRQE